MFPEHFAYKSVLVLTVLLYKSQWQICALPAVKIKKINFAMLLVCALKVTAATKLCSTDQMVFFITETRFILGHMETVRLCGM
jgi:hypothetical protein